MKRVVGLLIMMLVTISLPVQSSQAELDYSRAEMDFTARKYIMLLNQQPVKLETSPIWKEESGLLLIPLRFIAEMNRFSVTWDASANQATFIKGDRRFIVIIQKGTFRLLSNPSSVPPYTIILKSNRLLLDHRTTAALLNIKFELDSENQQAVFSTPRDQILYMAPQFSLFDIKGNQIDLQKTLDEKTTRLVILNFYSTRCPICAKAIPNLQKLHEDYLSKGIVVIGINTDTKNMEKERDEAIKKYGLTYPILLDPNADVYTAYSVAGIPNLFVINQKREIIQHRLGVDDSYFVFLRKYLDTYLKTK
jgi:peroxiredoxin